MVILLPSSFLLLERVDIVFLELKIISLYILFFPLGQSDYITLVVFQSGILFDLQAQYCKVFVFKYTVKFNLCNFASTYRPRWLLNHTLSRLNPCHLTKLCIIRQNLGATTSSPSPLSGLDRKRISMGHAVRFMRRCSNALLCLESR